MTCALADDDIKIAVAGRLIAVAGRRLSGPGQRAAAKRDALGRWYLSAVAALRSAVSRPQTVTPRDGDCPGALLGD